MTTIRDKFLNLLTNVANNEIFTSSFFLNSYIDTIRITKCEDHFQLVLNFIF